MCTAAIKTIWTIYYRIVGLVVGIILVSCGASQTPVTPVPGDVDSPPDTTVGPTDVFEVRVYGEEELSDEYRVESNGKIDFPLVGKVYVNKMTPSQIGDVLEKELINKELLKNPQVSVFVKKYNSKKISVFGEVKDSGTFPWEDGMTVVEAISLAGGFSSMAKKNETTVIRVINGKEKRYKIPVEAIGQGRAENFILRSGDIVFVPERII